MGLLPKKNVMKLDEQHIQDQNEIAIVSHNERYDFLSHELDKQGIDVGKIVQKISDFQVAIPSWALGAGGTRFGRFSYFGEPSTLEQK